VVLSAWVGGVGPGLLATVTSALAVDYFFVPPLHTIQLNQDHIERLITFVSVALLISWLNESLKRERSRAEAKAEEAKRELAVRTRVEQDLRASQARAWVQHEELESIYRLAPVGLCALDTEMRVVHVNERFAELDGWPPEQHQGRRLEEVFPGLAPGKEAMARLLREGEPVLNVEVAGEARGRPGVACTWIASWVPIRVHGSEVTGVNVVVEDVTEARRIEQELRRASQMKDTFLSTLSHELRTPLNAILGWSQMLLAGRLDPQTARRALESIDRSARVQAALVNDVLDLSRIVSGKMTLRRTLADLRAVVDSAVDTVRMNAESRRIHLSCDFAFEAIVFGDPDRLQQIFWNLLSNAVKFTQPGGHVSVSAERSGTEVTVHVTDTGVGIASDFLPHVFESFTQADGSTAREYGGLGLGLSIVRNLVEAHGGSVSAASPGQQRGSTFTVLLPLAGAATERQVTERSDVSRDGAFAMLSRLRVLLVDDDADARDMLRAVLGQYGVEVVAVASGEEGLAHLREASVDLIISDVAMPHMDGYEFMRRAREIPRAVRIPAVAVTAYGREEDRMRALEAGYQQHVCKPMVPEEFMTVVAALARTTVVDGNVGARGSPSAGGTALLSPD
jgi:PAS domain S-box-containing protein